MAHTLEHYQKWLEHDGKVIVLDGIKHVLRVQTYHAIFPYEHDVITVHAEVKDKRSKYYQTLRHEFHDDWSTDILDSDVTIQAHILSQLQEN